MTFLVVVMFFAHPLPHREVSSVVNNGKHQSHVCLLKEQLSILGKCMLSDAEVRFED